MSEESLEHFLQELDALDESRAQLAHVVFQWLSTSDPKLATHALKALETDEKAAMWFTRKVLALGNETPLKLIKDGKREQVIDCLYKIEYGMFA